MAHANKKVVQLLATASMVAAAVPEGPNLVLGFLYYQLGPPGNSWLQESWAQFKLAVKDVNANSTILPNSNLSFIVQDSGGSETTCLKGAVSLTDAGVFGIVGTGYSSEMPAASSYCSMRQVPIMSPGSTAVSLIQKTSYPYMLRSIPSDGTSLKAMAVATYQLGWRRAAMLTSAMYELGTTLVLRPTLDALGISYLALTYPLMDDDAAKQRTSDFLALVAASGYRIILLYPKSSDMVFLYDAAGKAGLRDLKYTWVPHSNAVVGIKEWSTMDNVVVALTDTPTSNPVLDDYKRRWPKVTRCYNASVDGVWNRTTGMPFWGANTYSDLVFDTDYGPVCDHKPDYWGTFVYDAVWIYAYAMDAMIKKGLDPSDGASLREHLLDVHFLGITGEILFDKGTQDRSVRVKVALMNSTGPSFLIATSNDNITSKDMSACRTGCLDLTTAAAAGIPWKSGLAPTDGLAFDPAQSSAIVPDSAMEDSSLDVRIQSLDSFGRPPCRSYCGNLTSPGCVSCVSTLAAYSKLELRVVDDAGDVLSPKVAMTRTWDVTAGVVRLSLPQGLVGSGDQDRVVRVYVLHMGRSLQGTPETVTLQSRSCAVGEEVEASQSSRCVPCGAGSFNPVRGGGCEKCPTGKYQDLTGMSDCEDCSAGRYQSKEGMQSCPLCGPGQYQPAASAATCMDCPGASTAAMSTMLMAAVDVSSCVCPEGFYRPLNSLLDARLEPPCSPCPSGMECKKGSDARNFPGNGRRLADLAVAGSKPPTDVMPLVKPGYWTSPDDPLSVFLCKAGPLQCPGGPPGSCGALMEARTCAHCAEHYYRDGDRCVACPSEAASRFVFPMLPIIVSLMVVGPFYFISIDRAGPDTWNRPEKSLPILATLAVSHSQVVGLYSKLNLQIPHDVGGFWLGWSGLLQPMNIFRQECGGLRSFQADTAVKLVTPVYGLAIFAAFYVAAFLLSKCSRLRIDRDVLFGCFGAIFYAFFTSVCAMAFSFFKCYKHPNGTFSVQSAPEVLCFSDEWNKMVAAGLVCVAVYCCGSIVLFSYIIFIAPREERNPEFQKRWKFLIAKYRPSANWWSIVWLLKGVALNLASVIFVKGTDQLFAMLVILVTYLSFVQKLHPWRHIDANDVDGVVNMTLVFIGALFFWYSDPDPTDAGAKGLNVALAFTPIFVTVVLGGAKLFSILHLKSNPEQQAKQLLSASRMPSMTAMPRVSSKRRSDRDIKTSDVDLVQNMLRQFAAFALLPPEDVLALFAKLPEVDRKKVTFVHSLLQKNVNAQTWAIGRLAEAHASADRSERKDDLDALSGDVLVNVHEVGSLDIPEGTAVVFQNAMVSGTV